MAAVERDDGETLIQHIRQRETFDCLIACFAMVTGKQYEEVRKVAGEDISTRPPESQPLFDWLKQSGFRVHFRMPENLSDWPQKPFTDVHICSVLKHKEIAWSHGIVLLRDGTVLDPDCDEKKRLSDYYFVNWMCGIRPNKRTG